MISSIKVIRHKGKHYSRLTQIVRIDYTIDSKKYAALYCVLTSWSYYKKIKTAKELFETDVKI